MAAVVDVAELAQLLAFVAIHLVIAAAFDRAAFGCVSLRIGVHRELLLEIHAAVARKVLLFARVALHVEECLLGQATRVCPRWTG